MNQDLYFVLYLLGSVGLAFGIYVLAMHKRSRLTTGFQTLCNDVWQIKASLRTREWESDHPTRPGPNFNGQI